MSNPEREKRGLSDERTVLINGRVYPSYFGPAMTPVLIHIVACAALPKCELFEQLDLHQHSTTMALERLRARGVILGRHTFRLNAYLSRYYELRAYLRELAKKLESQLHDSLPPFVVNVLRDC
jgi:hypothetical protein